MSLAEPICTRACLLEMVLNQLPKKLRDTLNLEKLSDAREATDRGQDKDK